ISLFFFSSRRRHTRFSRDWSSDVCSSDLRTRQEKPEGEYTEMGWEVYPDGLYTLLKRVHSDYSPRAIYITENGAAFADQLTPDEIGRASCREGEWGTRATPARQQHTWLYA